MEKWEKQILRINLQLVDHVEHYCSADCRRHKITTQGELLPTLLHIGVEDEGAGYTWAGCACDPTETRRQRVLVSGPGGMSSPAGAVWGRAPTSGRRPRERATGGGRWSRGQCSFIATLSLDIIEHKYLSPDCQRDEEVEWDGDEDGGQEADQEEKEEIIFEECLLHNTHSRTAAHLVAHCLRVFVLGIQSIRFTIMTWESTKDLSWHLFLFWSKSDFMLLFGFCLRILLFILWSL